MELLSRDIKKLIEDRFRFHDKIKRAVELERESLIKGRNSNEAIGASPTGRISDPVGTRGVMLADIPRVDIEIEVERRNKKEKQVLSISWPERWLKVIDRTRQKFAEGACPLAKDLIEFRYARGHDLNDTMAAIGIDRATYYNWRDGILYFAGMVAAELGIIKVS